MLRASQYLKKNIKCKSKTLETCKAYVLEKTASASNND